MPISIALLALPVTYPSDGERLARTAARAARNTKPEALAAALVDIENEFNIVARGAVLRLDTPSHALGCRGCRRGCVRTRMIHFSLLGACHVPAGDLALQLDVVTHVEGDLVGHGLEHLHNFGLFLAFQRNCRIHRG